MHSNHPSSKAEAPGGRVWPAAARLAWYASLVFAGTGASLFAADTIEAVAAPAKAAVSTAPAPARTRQLDGDELRGLLEQELNKTAQAEHGEWELHLTRPWTPLTVPNEPLKVEILEPAPERITAENILRVELRAGRQVVGAYQVPTQARLWRDVLVAESALRRGEALADAAVTHERRDTLTLHGCMTQLPSDPGAYEVSESVQAGAVLSSRAVRLKPVVYRGQMADATVSDGALVISLKVEVLEEGVPGQVVRVRNPQSHRELRGKVQNEKTISITM